MIPAIFPLPITPRFTAVGILFVLLGLKATSGRIVAMILVHGRSKTFGYARE
jgi:hypothetical protein